MGDLIGALADYIGGKDHRKTGHMTSLPVYNGKLVLNRETKPTGEMTEKQKEMNDYLKKYQGGEGDADEMKQKKKKRKVRRGEEPGKGIKIVDEDKGLGGLALAKVKERRRNSEDGHSDDQAVVVDAELGENNDEDMGLASVQVVGDGSQNDEWITVDADGNVVDKNRKKNAGRDASPSRRSKLKDDDLSPPRARGRSRVDEDLSPPRRKLSSKGDADLSPPRRRNDSPDLSPPRNRGGQARDSADLSPPRRRNNAGSQEDLSPPRRRSVGGKEDTDQSPPRKRARHDSDSEDETNKTRPNNSKKRHDSDSDVSPPRRQKAAESVPSSTRTRHDSDSEGENPSRVAKKVDGLKAGYVSGKELTQTMLDKKREQDLRFKSLDDETTGRTAETVYRDKKGKKVDPSKMTAQEREEYELKNMVWGKGLVQMEERKALQDRIEEEKHKPFARTIEDKDMNDELKAVERWGDPMAGKIKKVLLIWSFPIE
eukprot:762879-Hanusia_phi.AAC.3